MYKIYPIRGYIKISSFKILHITRLDNVSVRDRLRAVSPSLYKKLGVVCNNPALHPTLIILTILVYYITTSSYYFLLFSTYSILLFLSASVRLLYALSAALSLVISTHISSFSLSFAIRSSRLYFLLSYK